MGAKLPKSAYDHRAWWANSKRPPATIWLGAGWQVDSINLGKSIKFKQIKEKKSSKPKSKPKRTPAKKQKKAAPARPKAQPKAEPKHRPEPISEYIPKLIKDFHQLKVEGIITDGEFREKKKNLLEQV